MKNLIVLDSKWVNLYDEHRIWYVLVFVKLQGSVHPNSKDEWARNIASIFYLMYQSSNDEYSSIIQLMRHGYKHLTMHCVTRMEQSQISNGMFELLLKLDTS
jgi:predicted ATPase